MKMLVLSNMIIIYAIILALFIFLFELFSKFYFSINKIHLRKKLNKHNLDLDLFLKIEKSFNSILKTKSFDKFEEIKRSYNNIEIEMRIIKKYYFLEVNSKNYKFIKFYKGDDFMTCKFYRDIPDVAIKQIEDALKDFSEDLFKVAKERKDKIVQDFM